MHPGRAPKVDRPALQRPVEPSRHAVGLGLLDQGEGRWDTATLSLDLDAGTHPVVVDSGDALFLEPMAADYDLTRTVTTR